jgi:hypothetical protein
VVTIQKLKAAKCVWTDRRTIGFLNVLIKGGRLHGVSQLGILKKTNTSDTMYGKTYNG